MTSLVRHIFAFLAAASAPAIPILALSAQPAVFLLIFLVALIHVLILAVPIYALLSSRYRATPPRILTASFLIGALPLPLLVDLAYPISVDSNVWSGGVQTIEDGVRTWHGWLELMIAAGGFGLFGATGGLAFWLVLRSELATR